MATSSKPRRKYRPRVIARNPITVAMRRASKIPADEVATVMLPIAESFTAMREGVATEPQWLILAGSVELALAIERQGVVRGVAGHLTAAEAALAAIKHRAMERGAWRSTSLYWQEIEALDTFLAIHKYQLENLSEGEWQRAANQAEAVVRSAGGQVVDIRELQSPEQLSLLNTPSKPHHP
jgi:hypothetical protein